MALFCTVLASLFEQEINASDDLVSSTRGCLPPFIGQQDGSGLLEQYVHCP